MSIILIFVKSYNSIFIDYSQSATMDYIIFLWIFLKFSNTVQYIQSLTVAFGLIHDTADKTKR